MNYAMQGNLFQRKVFFQYKNCWENTVCFAHSDASYLRYIIISNDHVQNGLEHGHEKIHSQFSLIESDKLTTLSSLVPLVFLLFYIYLYCCCRTDISITALSLPLSMPRSCFSTYILWLVMHVCFVALFRRVANKMKIFTTVVKSFHHHSNAFNRLHYMYQLIVSATILYIQVVGQKQNYTSCVPYLFNYYFTTRISMETMEKIFTRTPIDQ